MDKLTVGTFYQVREALAALDAGTVEIAAVYTKSVAVFATTAAANLLENARNFTPDPARSKHRAFKYDGQLAVHSQLQLLLSGKREIVYIKP